MTDPIADMLTRIRNAINAKHAKVDVPASNLKTEIARILKDEGYIADYKVSGEGVRRSLRIRLKYSTKNEPVITSLQRISKPGRRVYLGRDDIRLVLGGLGLSIISTSKGLMSGQQARKQNMGGEHVCNIY
jgi:small subunit ribosomal protein S8